MQMKDAILLELAERWERDAVPPQCSDGSPEAAIGNAVDKGQREAKRECADTLRTLVSILGGNSI
jgi:hypothetical protein